MHEKYREMIRLLQNYRDQTYEEWIGQVDADCQFNLEQPLLRRDLDSMLLRVNFSQKVGVSCAPMRSRPANIGRDSRCVGPDPSSCLCHL